MIIGNNSSSVNDMSNIAIFFVIVAVLIAAILGFLFVVYKKVTELLHSSQNDQSMNMINQSMIGVQDRLDKTTESLNLRLDNAARVIVNVQKELSTVQEIGRGIKEFQQLLNSPKLRGNIGEHILNDSLSQVFSDDHYDTQYRFHDGSIVDAIVRTSNGIIPIDSKFPMENFRKSMTSENQEDRVFERKEAMKAVKKHIDDISRKYILPGEGTVDFAVMYVPSENIYYEVMMADEDIMTFARQKKVLLVSPNSFFHFLKIIMMGLERVKLHEEAKKILEIIKGIQQEAVKFGDVLTLTNKHVTNAKNAMDATTAEYTKFSSLIDQVKLLK